MPTHGRGERWSVAEIEAAIDLYFGMLDRQLHGDPFVKLHLYRDFCTRFPARSRPSIERKCQNIAACLANHGIPLVRGLVPLFNLQAALMEAVARRIADREHSLRQFADSRVEAPGPVYADIEDPVPSMPQPAADEPESVRLVRRRIDYVAREQANRSLGLAGELWAVEYERIRLLEAGHKSLSRQVRHVSAEEGDGAGYDIESFDPASGQSTLIEVKTTRASIWTPFYLTPNELSVSERNSERFRLYRLHSFGERTRMYVLCGSLHQTCALQPQSYRALPFAKVG
jgi:hypothetical protein